MKEREFEGLELVGQLLLEKGQYFLLDGDNVLVDSASAAVEELKRELKERNFLVAQY